MNILKKLSGLKRYFTLCCWHKQIPKKELLTSNEALKAMGRVGNEYKADVMMMLAVIEYEFGRNYNYSEKEMAAVKTVLAEVMKYFISCGQEWSEYEAKEAKKAL